jgi:hypothetical protein
MHAAHRQRPTIPCYIYICLSQCELNDGRQFESIKIFYQPMELQQRLHALGWHVTVDRTAQHFLYGSGHQ